jgi:hypothetical protein
MVKVSITLPNNAQITFESEEPEVIHEVVGMVLRDLPRDLMQSAVHINGNGGGESESLTDNGSVKSRSESSPPESSSSVIQQSSEQSTEKESAVSPPRKPTGDQDTVPKCRSNTSKLTDAEQDFVAFCQKANPLGDMRRVVVAAEGASRYLEHESVNSEELGRLFDLAGWQRPHSFVQTLRNAARSKFRWLERVPGRSGQYKVTDLGRSTAFSS